MTKIKKLTYVILAFALAAFFTACNNEVENNITDTEKDDTTTVTTPIKDVVLTESTVVIEESAENTSTTTVTEGYIYPDNDEERLALIDKFEGENFFTPDGNKINKNQAADVFEYEYFDGTRGLYLKFDSGYIRYAKPVFKSTLDEPPITDGEKSEWSEFKSEAVDDPNYFEVKAGDVLENGLTVASAFYLGYSVPNSNYEDGDCGYLSVNKSEIRLDGAVTMEGILHCVKEDGPIDQSKGELLFYPDSLKCNTVMLPADYVFFKMPSFGSTVSFYNSEDKVGIRYDGTAYELGNISSTKCSLEGIFDENEIYVKVKATIDSIVLLYGANGDRVTAELISVEKI